MKTLLVLSLLACTALPLSLNAQTDEEARLAGLIRSTATPNEKEDACWRLKQIGTASSVAAIATLLPNEHLYQAACDALETMALPEAGAALQAALKTTTGAARAGVIQALGERREQSASGELANLLRDANPTIASCAARALGKIGGDDAVRELQNALPNAKNLTRSALVDALLRCASQFVQENNLAAASRIYRQFDKAREPEHIRAAAYAGLIRTAGDNALKLVVAGIKGRDVARQGVALQLARDVRDPKATAAFTNLLTKASPALQAALLGLLQQRGDPAAAPAVVSLARSDDPYVRNSALAALGTLGDASTIRLLAEAAASHDEAQQKVARESLIQLRRGDVTSTLVEQLAAAPPEIQVELIRALTARFDQPAVPKLLEIARNGNPSARHSALRGLEQLADARQFSTLVDLLIASNDASTRAEVQNVFEAIADRFEGRQLDVTAISKALRDANISRRLALLPICAFFEDDQLRTALRNALTDSNSQIRETAAQTLCASRDGGLIPDLLGLARSSPDLKVRPPALEGYVRLVRAEPASFPARQRAEQLRAAYDLATRSAEKRLVLSALGGVADIEALDLARRACAEAEVRAEAEVACLQIAKSLLASEPTAARVSLQQITTSSATAGVKDDARSVLQQFDSGWLFAGPFLSPGKDCRELFNIAFAPEQADASPVEWRRAPGSADLTRPDEVDLAGGVQGNDRVMYLKTRVFAPAAQPVVFDIGSDDGIKLWVNGKLTHSNNAIRGMAPGQDHAAGTLREGWNDLFAKITQSTAGCGMILQIKTAQGKPIAGLQVDPHGGANEASFSGYKKLKLSDQFYAEGAYYGDFNRDGKMDIVAGPFWFEGPDFTNRHEYRPAKAFDPNGYSDNFLTYTADFNNDGWTDIFCVPFPGAEGFWFENPGKPTEPWPRHPAYGMVGNESPVWCDVDADGKPDLVFNNEGYLGYATFDPAQPNQNWLFHAISPKDARFQRFTHGIGAGDINGDGRVDVIEAAGWWEQPPSVSAVWKFHPHKFAEAASQMLITDVDGDGLVDVVNAWHCHHYGLVWSQQIRGANGAIDWKQHVILPPTPDLTLDGVRISQMHSMTLADMNGDGLPDVVTGKRFWAHNQFGDVEPDAPAVLVWFELQRHNGEVSFVPHQIDADSGVGTQVTTTDLNRDGRPDVIVANKKGIFIQLSEAGK